jgi:hypothetical protein
VVVRLNHCALRHYLACCIRLSLSRCGVGSFFFFFVKSGVGRVGKWRDLLIVCIAGTYWPILNYVHVVCVP